MDTDDDVVDGPRRHDRKPNDGWTRHPQPVEEAWLVHRAQGRGEGDHWRPPSGRQQQRDDGHVGSKNSPVKDEFRLGRNKGREWPHSVQLYDRIRLNACVSNLSHVFK